MRQALALAGLIALAAPAAQALTLSFPAKADLQAEKTSVLGSYRFPVGPWKDGGFKTVRAEGPVIKRAWRIEERDLTTMQVMASLRSQLEADGFVPLFECDTNFCGGFDFRYNMQILPEPQMHVDLGDFRYLVLRRDSGSAGKDTASGSAAASNVSGMQYVGLLVSRSNDAGFAEVIQVGLPLGAKSAVAGQAAAGPGGTSMKTGLAAAPAPAMTVATGLAEGMSVPLDDLNFPSGSSELAPGEYASLGQIAAYMKAHPDQHITLVGHTDTVGGFEPNLVLSKKRAASVRDRLIKQYGVNPDMVAANGVGYLAPRASNATKAGREQNRRVEAMVDSTQ